MPNDVKYSDMTLGKYLNQLIKQDSVKAMKSVMNIAQHTSLEKHRKYVSDTLKAILQYVAPPFPKEVSAGIQAAIKDLSAIKESFEELEKLNQDKKKNAVRIEEIKSQIKATMISSYNVISSLKFTANPKLIIAWENNVKELCYAQIGETGAWTSIYDKPLMQIDNPDKNKLGLRDHMSPDMNAYLYVKAKGGGANSPGKFGGEYIGCYLDENNNLQVQRSLFKQDTKKAHIYHDKNIAEFVAGHIMNELIGDSAASVFFARAPDDKQQSVPDSKGSGVYVASIFYDGFQELFKVVYTDQGKTPPEDRVKGKGTVIAKDFSETFDRGMVVVSEDGSAHCRYGDFPQTVVAPLLVGNFDLHSGNFGVVTNKNGEKVLVVIDHGAALDHLEDNVHMHSHSRHPVGLGPTNHLRELPRALKISPEFAAELERVGGYDPIQLNKAIDIAMGEMAANYGRDPIAEFANTLGMKVDAKASKEQIVESATQFLKDKMAARQVSLMNLALEIRMSLAVKLKADGSIEPNKELDDLIKKNPNYFLQSDFHFRGKEQRDKFLFVTVQKSEYPDALKKHVQEVLGIPAAMPGFLKKYMDKDKEISERAECLIAMLKGYASLQKDPENRKACIDKVKKCQKALNQYRKDPNEYGLHLIHHMDEAYHQANVAHQQLSKQPAVAMQLAQIDTVDLFNKKDRDLVANMLLPEEVKVAATASKTSSPIVSPLPSPKGPSLPSPKSLSLSSPQSPSLFAQSSKKASEKPQELELDAKKESGQKLGG